MARRLLVEIIGDSKSLERSFDRSSRAARNFDRDVRASDRSLKGVNQTLRGALSGLGSRSSLLFGSGAFIATAGLTAGFTKAVTGASDLNEAINAVNVTFGEASDTIKTFSTQAVDRAGLSMRQFDQLVVPLGASLQNYGLDAAEAASESIKLTQRAADMASVFNTDVSDALEAIQSLLRGEADPIERFGVGINEAAIKQEALSQGLAHTAAEITAQDKTVARLALLYQQTNKFAGDFANTSGELANRQRILRARFANLTDELGTKLLPAMNSLTAAAIKMVDVLSDIPGVLADIKSGEIVGGFFSPGVKNPAGAIVKLPKDVTIAQIKAVRDQIAALRGDSDLMVVALDNAILKIGETSAAALHSLDLIEQARSTRFDQPVKAAAGSTGGGKVSKTFELPQALQIAQARAAVTATIKDDVAVAKDIVAHIRKILSTLKGDKLIGALGDLASAEATIRDSLADEASKRKDAADNEAARRKDAAEKEAAARKKHADAVKRAAEKQRAAAEEAARRISEATDQARAEIGDLFAGPVLNPTDAARKAALGVPGPDPTKILADIRAQSVQALRFERDLRRLRRLGVGGKTIEELRGQGTAAIPNIEAILNAPRGLRANLVRSLIGRERTAQRIGQMIVHTPKVTLHAKQVVLAGGGGPRTTQNSRSGRYAGN